MANYQYQTIYGIEPYAAKGVSPATAFGGGADVTNDNLIITMWNLPGFNGSGFPTTGQLLKPFRFSPDGLAAIAGAGSAGVGLGNGFNQVFNSRYSSRFYLQDVNIGQEVPQYMLTEFLLAVLQPPQDVVNDFLTYAKNIAPGGIFGTIDFLRSFFYGITWNFRAMDLSMVPVQEGVAFGGLFNLGGAFSFMKTNGADGVFPEFYPTTPVGFLQLMQDITSGKPFYIPCIFTRSETFETELPEMFEISWPGSNARR